MFLAAAPYFQRRFRRNEWILNYFQPAEITVWTSSGFIAVLVLSYIQKNARYTKRILIALLTSLAAFVLLAFSTLFESSAEQYFGFLLTLVLIISLSTGLLQNGIFAYTGGFGRPEYTQAIMTGQAVAGVLPPMVQIISVMSVPSDQSGHVDDPAQSPKSAFAYFATAVGVLTASLLAFIYLLNRKQTAQPAIDQSFASLRRASSIGDVLAGELASADTNKISVPLLQLLSQLRYLSAAVVICFAVTMAYPIFTTVIVSVSGVNSAVFIPLAFLLWNVGDLFGRLITISPKVSLTHHPFALLCISMARLLFIPLYFLCNIKNRGAMIGSDFFYLIVVQFLFGLTNGYLGSQCMMGAPEWVHAEEREAAGAFMAMMLCGGLALGSVLSFLFGDI